jgi:uncharacterized protein (TIGR02246 family)
LIERWHDASAAGDLQTVLSLAADDVVFLTPGREPMDKDAFAAAFGAWAGRARLESRQDIKEIHTTGDLAYCWSHLSVDMTSLETGKGDHRAGQVLTVFRRSPAGSWVLSRDANLPTANAPAKS